MISRLSIWTTSHAAVMFLCGVVAGVEDAPTIVVVAGTISFLILILISWMQWTRQETFGLANSVTALRLTGVLVIGILPPHTSGVLVALFGLILLIADGLDGWIAKHLGKTSEFGEVFDKETDAYFMLIVCLILISRQMLEPWILIVGLLRYVTVLIRFFVRPMMDKERKSSTARVIFVVVVVALLVCFLPFPVIHKPIAIAATLLLIYSFFDDYRWIFTAD